MSINVYFTPKSTLLATTRRHGDPQEPGGEGMDTTHDQRQPNQRADKQLINLV